MQFSDIPA